MGEDVIGLAAVLCLFGWIPITAFYKSKIRLEELKLQQKQGADASTLQAVDELRREMQALRETSTKFDLSFDAGLSRLEERMNRVEGQQQTAVPQQVGQNAPAPGMPPRSSSWYSPAEERVARNGHG